MAAMSDNQHGFAAMEPNDLCAFNLSARRWTIGTGLEEGGEWSLETATGQETLFAHHLTEAIRKKLRQVVDDDAFTAELSKSSISHGELLAMLPTDGRPRHDIFMMFEELVNGKMNANLRRFTSMRLYINPEPGVDQICVRKFKGKSLIQTVVNLSDVPYRFFKYYGRQIADIEINPMLQHMSNDPERRGKELEAEIRMWDMNAFRRIREAADDGVIYLLLPQDEQQRTHTMEAFLKIIACIPSGAINLEDARVRRIFPA